MVDPSTNFMTIKTQLAAMQNIKDSADNETLSGNGVKAFDKICLYGPDKLTEMRSEATIADQEIDTDEIIYMSLRIGSTDNFELEKDYAPTVYETAPAEGETKE
jgi:hypothetical protein